MSEVFLVFFSNYVFLLEHAVVPTRLHGGWVSSMPGTRRSRVVYYMADSANCE